MKKTLLLAGLVLGLSATSFRSDAQVRVNINIGAPVAQQSWYGYDDDYYYMPDQGVYYNTQRRVYVYPERGGWVSGPSLPQRYGGCSYGNARYYRVRARAPFERNDYYRQQYASAAYNNGYERHDNGRHNGWNKEGRGNRDDRGGWNGGNDRRGDYGGGYGRR